MQNTYYFLWSNAIIIFFQIYVIVVVINTSDIDKTIHASIFPQLLFLYSYQMYHMFLRRVLLGERI